jgi:hypothetical protein
MLSPLGAFFPFIFFISPSFNQLHEWDADEHGSTRIKGRPQDGGGMTIFAFYFDIQISNL